MNGFRYGGAEAGAAGMAKADACGDLSGIQSKGNSSNFFTAV